MSSFSYSDYSSAVEAAKASRANGESGFAKIGYFKLEDDGDEALVRFNVGSVDELMFASVHVVNFGSVKWRNVSCLNSLGGQENICPLCQEAKNGNTAIGQVKKRLFVPVLVSYKDKTTGEWSKPIPVIWDRPASFSRDIATYLKDYGDLKNVLFKITRNGKKRDPQTTYNISFAVPTIFKPELIPTDFSAFRNFNVEKHSYYVKSTDEINAFLATGSFPETNTGAGQVQGNIAPVTNYAPSQPTYEPPTVAPQQVTPQPTIAPQYDFTTSYQAPAQPTQAPVESQPTTPPWNTTTPSEDRNFGGSKYSF